MEDAMDVDVSVACPLPTNELEAEDDPDEEAAEEKSKAEAEEKRNWLASASRGPTASLNEIETRADDVYRSTFQESFGF